METQTEARLPSEMQEFQAELQDTLRTLQQDSANIPDDDKVAPRSRISMFFFFFLKAEAETKCCLSRFMAPIMLVAQSRPMNSEVNVPVRKLDSALDGNEPLSSVFF